MTFYREQIIKSVRKSRACSGCCTKLQIGDGALECAGHSDGDFWSATYHAECREAEVRLNKLHKVWGGDDWMSLSDLECDDWPWLIEEYPVVAARMNVTTERYDKAKAESERCRAAWAKVNAKRWAERAQADTRRMAETGTGSQRSSGGPVGGAADDAPESPTP